jgi:predicted DNA-binding protein (UPF0251 family)
MNTITIQLCEEDRSRIDSLIGSISLLTSVLGESLPKEERQGLIAQVSAEQTLVEKAREYLKESPIEMPTAEVTAVDLSQVTEPTPEPAAPEVKPVSLAEFQKAVTMAVAKGAEAKKAAKAIINKYAESVSGVPEDKRAEVVAELANI